MIDEYWTWRFYGYHSDELSPKSHKRIVVVCDRCCRYRILRKSGYKELCKSCAHIGRTHTEEWKIERSIAMMGEKNPMYGKRGSDAPFYGHHHTEETKKSGREKHLGTHPTEEARHNMSIAQSGKNNAMYGRRGENSPLFGRHHSDETNRKIAASHTGNKSYNWKGGVGTIRHRIFRTRSYKNWRNAVFKRDNYTCQMCNTRNNHLQAHHIHPVRDHYNDLLLFDINNGITLCEDCHRKTFEKEYDFIEQFESIIRGDIK